MAIDPGVLGAGEPVRPARPLVVSRARTARRIVVDQWASRLVVGGGIIIIASILAILVVILAEVYPLFKKPTIEFLGTRLPAGAVIPAPGLAAGMDEYREVGYAVGTGGVIEVVGLKGDRPPVAVPIAGLDGARVSTVAGLGKGRHLIGTSDGRVIPLDMRFDVAFKDGKRAVTAAPAFGAASALDPERKRPLLRLTGAEPAGGPLTVAQVEPKALVIQAVVEKKALVGGSRREESLAALEVPTGGEITALALDGRAEDLFVGTSAGEVIHYDMRDRQAPRRADQAAVTSKPGAAVTTLSFLIGDRTLVVGDQDGGVATWQVVPPPGGGERRLTQIHRFAGHARPVVSIDASKRDKGFATADAAGGVLVHYGTSGQTFFTVKAPEGGLHSVVFAPKADGIVAVSPSGAMGEWRIDNPHPEITLRTVFGKVWYEGYSEPAYVWQSTGGTDDFEAKFSLTPLIYGTLKGTFYALVFAVPMALLAAVYVSEFMHPTVKAYVKPVVEVMAALPSVVLGFLAGLWLAPMVERVVPGLFLLPLVLLVCVLAAYFAWRMVPRPIRGRFKTGTEVFLLIPVVVAGVALAFALGGLVETVLLGGSYRGWLLSALGLTYDQRNSLVVGVAMGFAVIPIIFTIAEDSLANVPQHLRAGSLALGANRWQTALRIVLPTA
ncbi:MAG TPA: ABC transporter permease, partial [Methylomirabilota bacterium]